MIASIRAPLLFLLSLTPLSNAQGQQLTVVPGNLDRLRVSLVPQRDRRLALGLAVLF